MALTDDILSRRIYLLHSQMEWPTSPLLASAAGSAAWIRGDQPISALSAMEEFPGEFPGWYATLATQGYFAGMPTMLSATSRPPVGQVPIVPVCYLRCIPERFKGQKAYEDCLVQCTLDIERRTREIMEARRQRTERIVEQVARAIPLGEIAKHLAPWVLGIGLVLLGAYALVK